jgi:hypothetical protein
VFREDGIDLIQRGHTSLGKLKFTPAADDADPLAWRGPLNLFFQHAQSVGK